MTLFLNSEGMLELKTVASLSADALAAGLVAYLSNPALCFPLVLRVSQNTWQTGDEGSLASLSGGQLEPRGLHTVRTFKWLLPYRNPSQQYEKKRQVYLDSSVIGPGPDIPRIYVLHYLIINCPIILLFMQKKQNYSFGFDHSSWTRNSDIRGHACSV